MSMGNILLPAHVMLAVRHIALWTDPSVHHSWPFSFFPFFDTRDPLPVTWKPPKEAHVQSEQTLDIVSLVLTSAGPREQVWPNARFKEARSPVNGDVEVKDREDDAPGWDMGGCQSERRRVVPSEQQYSREVPNAPSLWRRSRGFSLSWPALLFPKSLHRHLSHLRCECTEACNRIAERTAIF